MTNRDMVKPKAGPESGLGQVSGQVPNAAPLPPMPAEEGSRSPLTSEEPVDSPQPNPDIGRAPPAEGEIGLTTER